MTQLVLLIITAILLLPSIDHNRDMANRGIARTQSESKYYYEMPEDELKVLSKAVTKLQLGDSRQKIVDLLGKPTADRRLKGPLTPNASAFRVIKYYVKKREKDFVYEKHDQLVSLYFDENDQLIRILSNVPSIKSRNAK